MSEFRTPLGEEVFKQKYSANQYESWSDRAHVIVTVYVVTMTARRTTF